MNKESPDQSLGTGSNNNTFLYALLLNFIIIIIVVPFLLLLFKCVIFFTLFFKVKNICSFMKISIYMLIMQVESSDKFVVNVNVIVILEKNLALKSSTIHL